MDISEHASERARSGPQPPTPADTRGSQTRERRQVDVDALKRAQPLLDVLARYGVTTQGSGAHRMAHCPFHDDARPSLGVYLDTNRFFCFRCGASGDVITLVERLEGIPFAEAVRRLGGTPEIPETPERHTKAPIGVQVAHGASMATPQWQRQTVTHCGDMPTDNRHRGEQRHADQPVGSRWKSNDDQAEDSQVEDSDEEVRHVARAILALLTTAVVLYEEALRRSEAAQAYLRVRGVSPALAARAHLGFADGQTLRGYLASHPSLVPLAHRVGLLDAAGRERLRGRLIVPELRDGLCLWLHGRLLPVLRVLPPASGAEQAPSTSTRFRTRFGADLRQGTGQGTGEARRLDEGNPAPRYLGLTAPKPVFGLGLALEARADHRIPGLESHTREERGGAPIVQGQQGVIVVEGAFDLLTALAWKLPLPCMALVGTHASARQRRELLQVAAGGPIWLALDGDVAGEQGAARLAAQLAEEPGVGPLRRLSPPLGAKDFGEVATAPEARAALLQTLLSTERSAHARTFDTSRRDWCAASVETPSSSGVQAPVEREANRKNTENLR